MARKQPTAVVFPDGNRSTFNVESWEVDGRGHLLLQSDGEEVATFSPHGWTQVYVLEAQAAMS